jgi:hypothetical protein
MRRNTMNRRTMSRMSVWALSAALSVTMAAPSAASQPDRLGGGSAPAAIRSATTGPILFGAYVGWRGERTAEDAVLRFEDQIGRPLAIRHVYHAWNQRLIGSTETWSIEQGHTLLINWKAALMAPDRTTEHVRWRSIANGSRDRVIRRAANELKALGLPVYLAFHHEPENELDIPEAERCGSRKSYQKAFQHIHEIFEEERARNVSFVWNMLGHTFRQGEADEWYPGDDVVDIVAADAYNWFGTEHTGDTSWRSFTVAFQHAYAWATARGKPFWVGETGVLEDPDDPNRKAQWYLDMAAQAEAWPNLRAIVYFTGATYGWWPDSSDASLAAFRQVVQDPYFGGP